MREPQSLIAARGLGRSFGGRAALAAGDLDVRARPTRSRSSARTAPGSRRCSPCSQVSCPRARGPSSAATASASAGRRSVPPATGVFPHARTSRSSRAWTATTTRARLRRGFSPRSSSRTTTSRASLSAGNRQRLNLATALVGDPDVLVLDEPTASLDPEQRRRFWEWAMELRARGKALVFATQTLHDVERFAERAAVLGGGEVVFRGPTREYVERHAETLFA